MNSIPPLEAVFHSLTDYAILTTDQDGLLTNWNATAERVFGAERCKVGQCISAFDAVDDAEPDVYVSEIATALAQGRAPTSRLHLGAGAVCFWGEGVINPIYDSGGIHLGFVKIIRDTSERRRAENEVLRAASTDALTALGNRAAFDARLMEWLETGKRNEQSVALHLIDLDDFKLVNDTLGHPAGDLLLKQVATRFAALCRKSDFVARLGGDEFALIQTDVDAPTDAVSLADKLLNTFSQPFDVDGHEVHATASIGIAVAPQDGWDPGVIVRKADSALYRVKRSGRNAYSYYTQELDRDAHRRSLDQAALHEAVTERQFHLVYQPKISAANGRLVGIEALLRCDHPVLTERPIPEIIKLATEYGEMPKLGEWIMAQACQQTKFWFDQGHAVFGICVNLSSRELADANTPIMVDRVLHDTMLPAHHLILELTEHELFDSHADGLAVLHALSARGISIALDDFGTGFSSLNYLTDLPVNLLKLDISIIRHLPGNSRSSKVVHAIIDLAHALGIKVVAEGVERTEQAEFLTHQGCEDLQGFLISRPLPAANMTTWLRQHAY